MSFTFRWQTRVWFFLVFIIDPGLALTLYAIICVRLFDFICACSASNIGVIWSFYFFQFLSLHSPYPPKLVYYYLLRPQDLLTCDVSNVIETRFFVLLFFCLIQDLWSRTISQNKNNHFDKSFFLPEVISAKCLV